VRGASTDSEEASLPFLPSGVFPLARFLQWKPAISFDRVKPTGGVILK